MCDLSQDYADKRMLDVFLAISQNDYVGEEDVDSKRTLVHKVCKIISDLKQEQNIPGTGAMRETPDELFARYIGIVAGLLDDATM